MDALVTNMRICEIYAVRIVESVFVDLVGSTYDIMGVSGGMEYGTG